MKEILKILKNRLRKRVNKQYVNWWIHNQKPHGTEGHHLLESFIGGSKWNDLLLAGIYKNIHVALHYKKQEIDEQILTEMFLQSLESLFDYVEHLQEENFEMGRQLQAFYESKTTIEQILNNEVNEGCKR